MENKKYRVENIMMAFIDYPKLRDYISIEQEIRSNDFKGTCNIAFTEKMRIELKEIYEKTLMAEDYINEIVEVFNGH